MRHDRWPWRYDLYLVFRQIMAWPGFIKRSINGYSSNTA